jgi:flagellar basal-body rod modification protein FlgD
MATMNGVSGNDAYMAAPTLSGNQTTSGVQRKTGGNSELDMDDFLQLMIAQLSNQDVMNPVSDTDFIAQMAQFSSLEGMKTLQEYTLSSYAVSYAGKHVIIASPNEQTGDLDTIYGLVERITFMNGSPKVVVNGVEYDLHTVMEVSDSEIRPVEEKYQKALMDKYAAIAYVDPATGETRRVYGKIDKVSYYGNGIRVRMDGQQYALESILKISSDPITPENFNRIVSDDLPV